MVRGPLGEKVEGVVIVRYHHHYPAAALAIDVAYCLADNKPLTSFTSRFFLQALSLTFERIYLPLQRLIVS